MNLIKRSPYHHKFVALGATFVDRLGFPSPMAFTSTEEEHRATREAVGIFDVYYQVAVEVAGRDAEAFLQRIVVADAAGLAVRRAVYTSLCNEAGGMIDDLTCFRLAPQRYGLFPTPSRVAAVLAALAAAQEGFAVTVTNLGYKNAYIVRGRLAPVLAMTDTDLSTAALPSYAFTKATVASAPGHAIPAPATPANSATSSSTRSSTRSTSGIVSSRRGARLASAPAASARCARCGWRRNICCSAWTPTTRRLRSKRAWRGRSKSTRQTSRERKRWSDSGPPALTGASC